MTSPANNATSAAIDNREAARRILALFDAPAPAALVELLLAAPLIPGLTEPFVAAVPRRGLGGAIARLNPFSTSVKPDPEAAARWQSACDALVASGEAARVEGRLVLDRSLRETTRATFATALPQAWAEANRRLFLAAYAEPRRRQPETAAEMVPLARAVTHAVRAGRTREAFDSVYLARVARGDACFIGMRLQAYELWVDMLSAFHETPWTRPRPELDDEQRLTLSAHTGLALRSLGRVAEAIDPVTATLEATRNRPSRIALSTAAQNMSEVAQALGNLDLARDTAEESVTAAALTSQPFRILSAQCRLGDVLHQRGETAAALALFEEAEQRQRVLNKALATLVSLRHAYYSDLLLTLGRAPEVLTRGAFALSVSEAFQGDGMTPLDIALDHLVLGRAADACARASTDEPTVTNGDPIGFARTHLDQAIEHLRGPGHATFLPAGLTARASFFAVHGESTDAQRDIEEAIQLARAGGLKLALVDALIVRATLNLEQRASDLAEAGFLVDTCNYARRRGEILALARI